jgi:hypothetical protein
MKNLNKNVQTVVTNIKPVLKIDWATHESAKFACTNWHYSNSLPVPPLVKIGVWENDVFIGVVLFSRGATPDLLKPYNLQQTEGCELTRIALNKHKTPVSRIMSIAFKFLKKNSPNLKLIVSFADQSKGHHGGIYQATNWIYAGLTAPSAEYWFKGKRWHPRQLSEKGYKIQFGNKRAVPKPSDCKKIKIPGKHRYLMPLDDNMREKIMYLSKPYPKRASSRDNAAPANHAGEGGASPTDALQ